MHYHLKGHLAKFWLEISRFNLFFATF